MHNGYIYVCIGLTRAPFYESDYMVNPLRVCVYARRHRRALGTSSGSATDRDRWDMSGGG